MRGADHEAEERGFVARFQRSCADCPRDSPLRPVEPGDGDFHFARSGGRLVIEVVKFIPDRIFQAQQAFHSEIATRLQQDLRQGRCGVRVHLDWKAASPAGVNRRAFTGALLEVINSLIPRPQEGREIGWDALPASVRGHLDGMKLGGLSAAEESSVNLGGSFWVDGEVPRIQGVIDGKEPNLRRYRSAGSEVWLLIVATHETIAALFRTREGIDTATFRSGFDRVYVLDCWDNWVQRLTLNAVAAAGTSSCIISQRGEKSRDPEGVPVALSSRRNDDPGSPSKSDP